MEEFTQAVNSGEGERVGVVRTEDAIFMAHGQEIIRGKEEMGEVWKRNVEGGFRTMDQQDIELHVSGDTGYEVVSQLWTVHEEGKEDEWCSSKFVHIWKKQPDGSWKLHLDIWNANPPLQK